MRYRFLDDVATADLAFEAYGKDLPSLFTNAALATADAMANLKTVFTGIKELDLVWVLWIFDCSPDCVI